MSTHRDSLSQSKIWAEHLKLTLATDYVSAVVGIFLMFTSGLWLAKRRQYKGPVSLIDHRMQSLC